MRTSVNVSQTAADSPPAEDECSFTPQINEASSRLARRSCAELCDGDLARRQKRAEELRQKQEQKEMMDLTFHPQVKDMTGVKGWLRLSSEPDNYLNRVDRVLKTKQDKIRRELKRREEKEAAECTFAPSIRAAPDYIRRGAASHRLLGQLREKENREAKPARPDWR